MEEPVYISAAVEGLVDEAVVRRIAAVLGLEMTAVYGLRGKHWLISKLPAYNQAARHAKWLVLLDLNGDAACAGQFLQAYLAQPSPGLRLRLAVREVESWLLADRSRLARFLSVSEARLPDVPDLEPDPKGVLVEIARHSRSRDIREAMVPTATSGRAVGPGYVGMMLEFIARWDPRVASESSESLRRCLHSLKW